MGKPGPPAFPRLIAMLVGCVLHLQEVGGACSASGECNGGCPYKTYDAQQLRTALSRLDCNERWVWLRLGQWKRLTSTIFQAAMPGSFSLLHGASTVVRHLPVWAVLSAQTQLKRPSAYSVTNSFIGRTGFSAWQADCSSVCKQPATCC